LPGKTGSVNRVLKSDQRLDSALPKMRRSNPLVIPAVVGLRRIAADKSNNYTPEDICFEAPT